MTINVTQVTVAGDTTVVQLSGSTTAPVVTVSANSIPVVQATVPTIPAISVAVGVQGPPGPGGSSNLPSQTNNGGKFLGTDGTAIGWTNVGSLINGSHSVVNDGSGALVLNDVQYIYAGADGKDIDIYTHSNNSSELWLRDNGPAQIITNGGDYIWNFSKDGKLTLPNISTIDASVAQVGYSYGPYTTDIYNNTTGGAIDSGHLTYIDIGTTEHNNLFNAPIAPVATITGTIAANGNFTPGTPTRGTFNVTTSIRVGGVELGSLNYRDDNNPGAGLRIGSAGDTYSGPTVTAGTLIEGWRGRQTVTPKTTTYIKWGDGSTTQITGSQVLLPNSSLAGIVTTDNVSGKHFPATVYTANYSAATTAIGINNKQWQFDGNGTLTFPNQTTFGRNNAGDYALASIDDLVLKSKKSVTISSGEDVGALHTSYTNSLVPLNNALAAGNWNGVGYPASYTSYAALAAEQPSNPLILDDWLVLANEVLIAYNAWQAALNASAVTIGIGDKGWYFGTDGKLTLPVGGVITGSGSSAVALRAPAGSQAVLENNAGYNLILAQDQDVRVTTSPDYGSTFNTWNFGTTGNLTFPDNTIQTTAAVAQIQSDWTQATTSALDYIKNKPTIPAAQIQSDWTQATNTALDYIKNKPALFSGSYTDLTNKPTIPSLTGYATETYVTTAVSNLVNSAPAALDTLNELATALGNDASFATSTATSLGNRLRIDTASQGLTTTQKSNAVTNLGLATVATSGSYADLSNKPTIPTVPTYTVTTGSASGGGSLSLTGSTFTFNPAVQYSLTSSGIQTAFGSSLAQNYVYAAPASGGAGSASFRALVAADIPTLAYSALTGTPTLATVATSGSYADLSNKPTIPAAATWPVTNTNGASGPSVIAIGSDAGATSQGTQSVAIGPSSGNSSQGIQSVAIGNLAGSISQGQRAVAIGSLAGSSSQGDYAVALGNFAGGSSQPANTIIINATGSALNGVSAQTNSFYVAPIRTDATPSNVLYYNTTTKEVTYGTAPAATLPSQSGNSGKYLTTDGSTASWGTVSGSGATVAIDTTDTVLYPTMSNANSGSFTTAQVNNNLTYNGVTSLLSVSTESLTGTGMNLVYPSQGFSATYWTATAVTVTANNILAPDGTTTGALITGSGASGAHALNINSATYVATGFSTSTLTRTYSCYFQKGTNNFVQMLGNGDTTVYANFDLNNGVLGTVGAGCTAAISAVAGYAGWYRCSITTSNQTFTLPFIYLITSATAARAETNTLSTTIYAWGVQCEYGSAPRTYQATTAAFVYGTPSLQINNNTVLSLDNAGSLNLGSSSNSTVALGSFATTLNIANSLTSTTAQTVGIATGTNSGTKTINIGTGGGGANITLGATVSGTTIVNSSTIQGAATAQNVFNTVATTLNFAGAAQALYIGSTAAGSTTVLNAPTVIGSNTTQNLYNTVATTVNEFGAATTINVAASAASATTWTLGNPNNSNSLVIAGGTSSGTDSISTTVTTGTMNVFVGVTGTLNVGSSTAGITGWAATATTSATAASLGYMGTPINTQAGTYTLVIGDMGKTIYAGGNLTIPANASVAFPVGTIVNIIASAGITVAITSDTLQWGAQTSSQTGTRTVAQYGMASLIKVASTTWYISGGGIT